MGSQAASPTPAACHALASAPASAASPAPAIPKALNTEAAPAAAEPMPAAKPSKKHKQPKQVSKDSTGTAGKQKKRRTGQSAFVVTEDGQVEEISAKTIDYSGAPHSNTDKNEAVHDGEVVSPKRRKRLQTHRQHEAEHGIRDKGEQQQQQPDGSAEAPKQGQTDPINTSQQGPVHLQPDLQQLSTASVSEGQHQQQRHPKQTPKQPASVDGGASDPGRHTQVPGASTGAETSHAKQQHLPAQVAQVEASGMQAPSHKSDVPDQAEQQQQEQQLQHQLPAQPPQGESIDHMQAETLTSTDADESDHRLDSEVSSSLRQTHLSNSVTGTHSLWGANLKHSLITSLLCRCCTSYGT